LIPPVRNLEFTRLKKFDLKVKGLLRSSICRSIRVSACQQTRRQEARAIKNVEVENVVH
jgi:hypothetical protein